VNEWQANVIVNALKVVAILGVIAFGLWFASQVRILPPPPVRDAVNGSVVLTRWHDPDHPVTCWVYDVSGGGGVSCLPDAAFE